MGSVTPYETTEGRRYRVRYRKPDHSQTDKRGFRTKREAELFLASLEVAKSRFAYIDPNTARLPLSEWLERWLETRGDLRPSTLDRIEGIVRRDINPVLGPIALGDLTRLRVQEWAGSLARTQSAWSVRKIVGTLSGALQLAVEDGRISSNPAVRLKLPKVVKVSKRYLRHEELLELAEAIERRQASYGLLVLVLGYCGLRWGELAGLAVGDLDVRRTRLEVRHTVVEVNGYLQWSRPKSYEERSVPVPPSLMDLLEQMTDGLPKDRPVFPGVRSGLPLRNRAFRRYSFDAAAAEVGLEGLTPHELRHTCASLAVARGANVKALQRMLGHASAKETLDTYTDLFEDDLDGVASALDAVLAPTLVGKMWAARPGERSRGHPEPGKAPG